VGEIRIGTSGWSYPTGQGTWNGVFYPARRPRGFDELGWYADHFDTVEVNSTFYRMPEPPVARSWLRRTPAGFLFSVKLFQKFTHPDMYLKRGGASDWDVSRDDFDLFRAGIDPIVEAGRLAAVLVQFPPSFHATDDTRAYLDWLLAGLAAYPVAVELRHRTWSDEGDDTRAQLAARQAAWVLIDEPKFATSVRQNLAPDLGTGSSSGLAYIRLHGRNAARWWEHDASEDRYNYLYSPEELAPFAEVAQESARTRQRVLMYLNNHFSAKAAANAAVLKHQVGQIVPGDYPHAMVERYPVLKDIVATSGLPL